jgi:NAD(P)-dependent dehydrogenase (short-subunit alcohol dehydrogenase family)
MDIGGRIAVVTGAGGGIGGAIVRALLDNGAQAVVATDVRLDAVEAMAAALHGDAGHGGAGGGRVFPRRLDVTDEKATKALVDEIEDTLGPIDLFFANAGVSGGGGPEQPDDVWTLQWNVNLMAHVHASRALLPGWLARGEGHLITTASMAGILTTLGDGVYAATKHAAVGFAEWMAITYGDRGIRVSCICPGAVDTDMLRGGAGGDAGRATAAIGGGEVLDADEAAARIVAAVQEDRFLILTHPDMQTLMTRKADDTDRWIRGMKRLWARTQELLAD